MNQVTMTGPKKAATFAVPRRCTANSATRIPTVIGSTKDSKAGVANFNPSTAESTEIAGVITESPRNIDAPTIPSANTTSVRRPNARVASAVSDSVPPSPLLSARSRINTYLIVTATMSDQRIIDKTPSTVSRVSGPPAWAATAASRKAYSGLVPISPYTTPTLPSVSARKSEDARDSLATAGAASDAASPVPLSMAPYDCALPNESAL
jgi:hypothetical protein